MELALLLQLHPFIQCCALVGLGVILGVVYFVAMILIRVVKKFVKKHTMQPSANLIEIRDILEQIQSMVTTQILLDYQVREQMANDRASLHAIDRLHRTAKTAASKLAILAQKYER